MAGNAMPIIIDIQTNSNIDDKFNEIAYAIGDLTRAVQDLDGASQSSTKSTNNNAQALANMVDGLKTGVALIDSFAASLGRIQGMTTGAFKETENVLADLNIVLGRTGNLAAEVGSDAYNKLSEAQKAKADELRREFETARREMDRLAQTTEFTYTQVGQLFATLKQQGLSTADILKDNAGKSILSQALSLSSASRGRLSLEESADAMFLSGKTLGGGVGSMAENADRFLRTINSAKLGFRDMLIAMESAGGAGEAFFGRTQQSQILTVLSALVNTGKTAAVAGNDLTGFGRSLFNITSALVIADDKAKAEKIINSTMSEMEKLKRLKETYFGYVSEGGGRARKRVSRPRTVKMFGLESLTLGLEDFIISESYINDRIAKQDWLPGVVGNSIEEKSKSMRSAIGEFLPLLDMYANIKKKFEAAVLDDEQFRLALGKSRKDFQTGGLRQLNAAERLGVLYKALGTIQSVQVFNALAQLEKSTGGENALFAFANNIDQTRNDALEAQKEILDTTEGRIKIEESVLFALNQRIGEVTINYEKLGIALRTGLAGGILDMVNNSSQLKNTFGDTIVLIKSVATAASVIASVAVGLFGLSQVFTSMSAALGTGSILSAFATQIGAILPLLSGIVLFVAGAMILIASFTQSLDYFNAVFTSVSSFLSEKLGTSVSDRSLLYYVENVLPILFGKRVSSGALESDVTGLAFVFLILNKVVTEFFSGIIKGSSFVITAVMGIFGLIAGVLKSVFDFGVAVIIAMTGVSDNLDTAYTETWFTTQAIGALLGVLLGLYMLTKAYLAMIAIKNGIAAVTTIVFKTAVSALSATLNSKLLASLGGAIKALYTYIASGSTALLTNLGMVASIAILVVALIALGSLVSVAWNQMNILTDSTKTTHERIAAFFALLATAVLIAVVVKVIIGLAVAFGVLSATGAIASASLLVVFGVVAGIIIVGYILYKVFSWIAKAMGWVSASAQDVDESVGKTAETAKDSIGDIKSALADSGLAIPAMNTLTPTTTALPTSSPIPAVSGVQGMPDLSALNMAGGVALPSQMGGNQITINLTHQTNVDQLDAKTARKVTDQIAPMLVDKIRVAMNA